MDRNKTPRVLLIGSVNSSRKTLEKLILHDLNVVGVMGLHPDRSKNVSGYVDLKKISTEHDIPFEYFQRVNSVSVLRFVQEKEPDYLFVVGLSQLIGKELLNLPRNYTIGYHPTKLPQGRGRAAIAWIILGKATPSATFFKIQEGMDDGPILAQQDYSVEESDYAQDVIVKGHEAIEKGLDKMLPELRKGKLEPVEQDHSIATFLGKRKPEDGHIDWNNNSIEIHRLIRAVSDPLPGAYTYVGTQKMIIHKAEVEYDLNILGVTGRILRINGSGSILVQTGKGLLWLTEVEGVQVNELRVGLKLGLDYEREILNLEYQLKNFKDKTK